MQAAMVVTFTRPVTGREMKALYAAEVADCMTRYDAALQSLA